MSCMKFKQNVTYLFAVLCTLLYKLTTRFIKGRFMAKYKAELCRV